MFCKTVIGSALLAAFLAMPVQASEIRLSTEVGATSDVPSDGTDCFYDENRNKPECRK